MEEEEEIPLKIIELSDFLRYPSIISKRIHFKPNETNQCPPFDQSDGFKSKDKKSGIVLLKPKPNFDNEQELIIPKDVIVFADDIDRKKIGLTKKSTNQFSRHLLITSGAALQALIPTLTNAKEWIIICKLKYFKRFTKELPIQGSVVMSLNINHPLVRYEILTAFDLLRQSFNEIKSAYIVINFGQILNRWFKTYLKRTDQYPSLSNRLLYRYQIETNRCSITLGKRSSFLHNDHHHTNTFQKMLHKSDIPMEIYIDFNSLPSAVYSIHLNNIFIYSMNDRYKQILKNMGNGLSLVSVQNINPMEEQIVKPNYCMDIVRKEDIFKERPPIQQVEEMKPAIEEIEEIKPLPSPSFYQPNEHEKILIEKVWDNRMRIQMQHEQIMMKAAKILCFSSLNNHNDSFISKNSQIIN